MEITLSTGQTAFALDDACAALQAALSREAILARTRRNATNTKAVRFIHVRPCVCREETGPRKAYNAE